MTKSWYSIEIIQPACSWLKAAGGDFWHFCKRPVASRSPDMKGCQMSTSPSVSNNQSVLDELAKTVSLSKCFLDGLNQSRNEGIKLFADCCRTYINVYNQMFSGEADDGFTPRSYTKFSIETDFAMPRVILKVERDYRGHSYNYYGDLLTEDMDYLIQDAMEHFDHAKLS